MTGEWFNEESFWTNFAPFMFDERRWAEVPAVVDGIAAMAGLRQGARILDLCCGPGRITLELARRGYEAAGLDITPSFLDAARESAGNEGLGVEWILADARDGGAVARGSFDLCLNLYTSFGYFDDPADDLALLRAARDSLKPGGRFILETLGKECAARDFVESEWYEKDDALVLASYKPLEAWRYLENRWIVVRDGKRFERSFRQRLYSGAELHAILEAAGFSDVRILGDFSELPYDEKARTLVATGVGL